MNKRLVNCLAGISLLAISLFATIGSMINVNHWNIAMEMAGTQNLAPSSGDTLQPSTLVERTSTLLTVTSGGRTAVECGWEEGFIAGGDGSAVSAYGLHPRRGAQLGFIAGGVWPRRRSLLLLQRYLLEVARLIGHGSYENHPHIGLDDASNTAISSWSGCGVSKPYDDGGTGDVDNDGVKEKKQQSQTNAVLKSAWMSKQCDEQLVGQTSSQRAMLWLYCQSRYEQDDRSSEPTLLGGFVRPSKQKTMKVTYAYDGYGMLIMPGGVWLRLTSPILRELKSIKTAGEPMQTLATTDHLAMVQHQFHRSEVENILQRASNNHTQTPISTGSLFVMLPTSSTTPTNMSITATPTAWTIPTTTSTLAATLSLILNNPRSQARWTSSAPRWRGCFTKTGGTGNDRDPVVWRQTDSSKVAEQLVDMYETNWDVTTQLEFRLDMPHSFVANSQLARPNGVQSAYGLGKLSSAVLLADGWLSPRAVQIRLEPVIAMHNSGSTACALMPNNRHKYATIVRNRSGNVGQYLWRAKAMEGCFIVDTSKESMGENGILASCFSLSWPRSATSKASSLAKCPTGCFSPPLDSFLPVKLT